MNNQSPVRMILNLMLIVVVVISVVATGFVSVKEYRSNRIPEIYSDKQIIKLVKDEYPDFEFDKNDRWTIESNLAENKKSFTANIDIVHEKDLCTAHYGVQLTFKLVKGTWKTEEIPNEIFRKDNEWHVDCSEWVTTANDETQYEVLVMSDSEVRLTIREDSVSTSEEGASVNVLEDVDEEETVNEDMEEDNLVDEDSLTEESSEGEDTDNNGSDSNVRVTDLNEILMCQLSESEDETSLTGRFDSTNKGSISLIITEDSVKLVFDEDGVELILEKK